MKLINQLENKNKNKNKNKFYLNYKKNKNKLNFHTILQHTILFLSSFLILL